MDARCLDYCVTEEERLKFERDGFFVLENVLPEDLVDELVPVVDRVDGAYREREGMGPDKRSNMLDFIGQDDLFLELLDWYKTFPKVWGLLNWNIQLYHSHMIVTPPVGPGKSLEKDGPGLGFHQDSGRLNLDIETSPRPRISLKVAFFFDGCIRAWSREFCCGSRFASGQCVSGRESLRNARGRYAGVCAER